MYSYPENLSLTGIYFVAFFVLSMTVSEQTQADTASAIEIGKKIYISGTLPDGRTLAAIGQGGLKTTGKQVTCMNCHRRSGYGTSEGSLIAPAINGKSLYVAREISHRELASTRRSGGGARPAYTDESLRRAIREGRGADGRSLSQFMPRFKLSDNDVDSLIAYLKVLGSETVPGVTEAYFEFSTIITPEVTDTDKKALLDLFNTYIDQINAGTRHESSRAKHPPWHKSWHYKAYRKWRLHVWELTGNPESWKKQLAHYYQQQPVFAVLNGIGGAWTKIDEFCDENEIPCLFPTTDLPGNTRSGFYPLYFSKGIYLDASLISHHIQQTGNQHADRLIQVYHDTDVRSIKASNQLKRSFVKDNTMRVIDYPVTKNKAIDYRAFNKIVSTASPYYLVLWGNFPGLLKQIRNTGAIKQARGIYLPTRFLAKGISTSLPNEYDEVHLVHRFVLPDKQKQHLLRFSLWARANKLAITDQQIMANAFFTLTILADAIRHIKNNISREYLIERIEHMVDNTLFHSVYPHLSLGPDQRYASKGGYIITYRKEVDTRPQDVKWIVP